MKSYYIYLNGNQCGPYDEATLRNMNLPPNTPVWCHGMKDWGMLSQVLGNNSGYQPQQPNAYQGQQQNAYQGQQQNAYQGQQQNAYQGQRQNVYQGSQQTAYQGQPANGTAFNASTAMAPQQLSLWGYYKKCWQEYATFSGRARRSEFWGFVLFNFLILLSIEFLVALLGIILVFLFSDNPVGLLVVLPAIWIFTGIYALAAFIPGLAVSSRRLHDTGRSFWWFLLGIIPIVNFIGGIVLLVFYFLDSEPMTNQYGPNPKTGM